MRKRSCVKACDLDAFCWPISNRRNRDSCLLNRVDSKEEGSESQEVLVVLSRAEASPELTDFVLHHVQ